MSFAGCVESSGSGLDAMSGGLKMVYAVVRLRFKYFRLSLCDRWSCAFLSYEPLIPKAHCLLDGGLAEYVVLHLSFSYSEGPLSKR